MLEQVEEGVWDEEDWKKKLRQFDPTTLDQAAKFATSLWEASKDLVSGHLLESEPDGWTDEWRRTFDYNVALQYLRDELHRSFQERKDKDENARAWLANKDLFEEFVKCMAAHNVSAEEPCEDTPLLKYVWARLAIEFAHEVVDSLFELGAGRILRLWALILSQPVCKSTTRFLVRVSRCFIWGFDAECVTFCRSSLDTAFRETITDEICAKHNKRRPEHGYTLVHRINAAYKEKRIDQTACKAADRVRTRGSKSVHQDPNVVKDVFGTVADTLTVISQLAKYMETPRD